MIAFIILIFYAFLFYNIIKDCKNIKNNVRIIDNKVHNLNIEVFGYDPCYEDVLPEENEVGNGE